VVAQHRVGRCDGRLVADGERGERLGLPVRRVFDDPQVGRPGADVRRIGRARVLVVMPSASNTKLVRP